MSKENKSNLRKRLLISLILILIVFPVALIFYSLYDNRSYGLISIFLIILAMIPFLMIYEMKKPQAREWIPLAVMAAIGAVGRVAFAPLPSFKPTSAIVIITASVFGPEAGFLTGAISALASNLFFGQGPWTPWQMFSWGLIGFLAGLFFKFKIIKGKKSLCLFGFLSGFLFGWIMNIFTAVSFVYDFSWKAFFALYISSFWFDFTHGFATAVFLYFLYTPWSAKLRRIKVKFGLINEV
ncbi:ECF transporter S component [Clostridium sp.]|uniref:ECF transporter S component n=1 Tax=Clostridium sp. TaxID=1506 RepID=UPI002634CFF2|nr:ECF transporter S component [Clostridium sp.]